MFKKINRIKWLSSIVLKIKITILLTFLPKNLTKLKNKISVVLVPES